MKKEIKHKKLIITLVSVGGAIIILASVLLGLFCPRKIGFYFNIKADKVDSVYAVRYEGAEREEKVYLDKDKTKDFLKALKRTTVKPKYAYCKCEAVNRYYIMCGYMVYCVDSLGVYCYKSNDTGKLNLQKDRIFEAKENDMEKLLKYFDM